MNKKNLKQEKGITLIALVITIIVMLILVAVTITVAVNGGLFSYAGKAARDTEEAKQKEQNLVKLKDGMTTEQLIAKYTGAITNPYDEDEWTYAWTCLNGNWSNKLEYGAELTGDVVGKLYNKGTDENGPFHLVIEKMGETGVMGIVKKRNIEVFIHYDEQRIPHQEYIEQPPSFYAWYRDGYNSKISNVTICSGVTDLGNYALENCINLNNIAIPISVSTIGEGVFSGCTNLATIRYEGTKTQWDAVTKGKNWKPETISIHCVDGDVQN